MQFFIVLLALLPAVIAGPMVKRVPSASCGDTSYTSAEIQQGIDNGESGAASSSDYPHQYNDYEGFDFSDYCNDSTYQEFPINHYSDGYTGGSPGADRVIYGTNTGDFCGVITHTGASGDNFVSCDY